MVIVILLAVSGLLNVGLVYLLVRSSRRLLEFDDLYELLVHDLETNLKYFAKLTNTPVLSNSPEIIEAQRNMTIMRDRLAEYVLRMEEITRRRLRKPEPKRPGPPPVVI